MVEWISHPHDKLWKAARAEINSIGSLGDVAEIAKAKNQRPSQRQQMPTPYCRSARIAMVCAHSSLHVLTFQLPIASSSLVREVQLDYLALVTPHWCLGHC